MPTVTFTEFPNNRQNPANPTTEYLQIQMAQKKAAVAARLISSRPDDGVVIANHYEWDVDYGMPSAKKSDGNVKTWSFPYAFEAVMVARNADGSWATEPNHSRSVEGFQWVSRELGDFYDLYRSHFPQVPKFVTTMFSKEEAERFQFGFGPAVDFPLAQILRNDPLVNFKPTFPPDIAFRVKDGKLEWFKISEYKAVYPLTVTATLAPPSAAPDNVVLMGVSMIMSGSGTPAEKVRMLKNMFGVA